MNRCFYSRERLEEKADEINQRFFPDRLSRLSPLDCYALLEKLGLDVEWKYISPNNDVLGMLFFESSCWYVWPRGSFARGEKPVKELFAQRTVVINQILLDVKDEEKERFVGVRLLSCNTGADPNGFAQRLADKLHVPVIAPTKFEFAWPSGKHGTYAGTKDEHGKINPDLSQPGEYKVFYPRRRKNGGN